MLGYFDIIPEGLPKNLRKRREKIQEELAVFLQKLELVHKAHPNDFIAKMSHFLDEVGPLLRVLLKYVQALETKLTAIRPAGAKGGISKRTQSREQGKKTTRIPRKD